MFASIKNLFVQAMIAIGIISSPQVIPPQEVISPEPQVIVQDQLVQNTQEIKKENPVVNKQKISNEKKTEEISIVKTETVIEIKEPEVIVKKVSGQCGNNNNKSLENIPTDKLCVQGNSSSVIEEGNTYKWSCLGSGGGKDIKCSAGKKQDGTCGSLANTIFGTDYDKEKLCSVGIASSISYIDDQSKWSCSGEYGGKNTTCYAFKTKTQSVAQTNTSTNTQVSTKQVKSNKINGSCGITTYSQYGISQYQLSDLCKTGTYSNLKENEARTTYTWSCNGLDGGTNISCSANYQCLVFSGYIKGVTTIPCR